MPSKYVHTKIDEIDLKLSNLDKPIYPEAGIVKAQVIEYYLKVAPLILKYIAYRPLTLIRYPDGINGTKFYSKSIPEWAPKWIERVEIPHSEEVISYMMASNRASVVWTANLAGLELHPMQMTIDKMENPDHFIFDLDPPEGSDFGEVKDIAFRLKPFLESYGYTPLLKTSGSKGLHIIVPIKTIYTHEQMVLSVKNLAQMFVKQNLKDTTLHIQKNSRQGKTLIDIYRNHKAQTTVAPYSLRAKPGAPISTPISWETLGNIKHSQVYTLLNIDDYLEEHGDLWDNWRTLETKLHDVELKPVKLDKALSVELKNYIAKRDFAKTPEPMPKGSEKDENRFVIQLHDASNLHYDLRLEHNGALLSWAIPKGMPHKNDMKRLAIQTETHPIEYLNFEGIIPSGEYGAGKMWVFADGKIQWIKKSETSYKFKLLSKQIEGEYSLFKTKGKQWIIEKKDPDEKIPLLDETIKPMLADASRKIPEGYNYEYEVKWDGIRAIITVKGDDIHIQSRSGKDLTSKFPELHLASEYFDIETGVFDGEIVCMDEQGRPIFSNVISRMHTLGEKAISKASQINPAVCYLFDCIYLDGRNISGEACSKRREWLKTVIKKQNAYRISESVKEGKPLFDAAKKMTLEGIMAKDMTKPYVFGKRSPYWIKVKVRDTMTCWIIGYTDGKGDRADIFGALHLAVKDGKNWKYMGKVGTGFNSGNIPSVMELITGSKEIKKPIDDTIEEAQRTHWMEAKMQCEIEYASLTNNGTLREPVFQHFRPDLLE